MERARFSVFPAESILLLLGGGCGLWRVMGGKRFNGLVVGGLGREEKKGFRMKENDDFLETENTAAISEKSRIRRNDRDSAHNDQLKVLELWSANRENEEFLWLSNSKLQSI